jgi:hypothetical protein
MNKEIVSRIYQFIAGGNDSYSSSFIIFFTFVLKTQIRARCLMNNLMEEGYTNVSNHTIV